MADIKKELDNLSIELRELAKVRWRSIENMLRFSVAAWVFGFSCFFSTVLFLGPEKLADYPSYIPFLLIGEAAALFVIGLRIRRFDLEINKLSQARKRLLVEYQKLVLSYVKRAVRERMPSLSPGS